MNRPRQFDLIVFDWDGTLFDSTAHIAQSIQAACADDPRRLKRLAARFSAPLLPDQVVTTTLWPGGEADGRPRLAFEMRDAAGTAVLTHGLAEVEG